MQQVSRRLVIYISGFDPRGAAYYHGLYVREAAKQAALTGMEIETGPRKRPWELASSWQIRARDQNGEVVADYDFMHWDDVVRAHWARGFFAILREILRSTWLLVSSGHLMRVLRQSRSFAFTAMLPFAVLAAAVIAGFLTAALVWHTGQWLTAPVWLAAALGLAGGIGVLVLLLRLGERANAFWIGRLVNFTCDTCLGSAPEVEERCNQFAAHIARRCKDGQFDEVLVVGHSVGSEMATRTMARLIETERALLQGNAAISLLTLGQTIPCFAMLPGVERFKQGMLNVALEPGLTWIDFSAPADPACFALVDPIVSCGLTRPAGTEIKPRMFSPRFVKLFSPQAYAALKRQKMTMHFMYLLATEIAGDYDYFAITAGSRRLAERYLHLAPGGGSAAD